MKHLPFLPARFLHDRTGTQRLRRGWPGAEWVLARELVHYERMVFPAALPLAQRHKALQLKVQAGSPYAQTGHIALWDGPVAQVWFWDKTHERDARRALVLPETLLHPPACEGEALRLLRLRGGYEGQYWKDGQLHSSRFWSEKPSEDAWLTFQRQASVPPGQLIALPEAVEPRWLDRPYARPAGHELTQLRAQSTRLWGLIFAGLGLAALWLGIENLKYRQLLGELEQRTESLAASAQAIIHARSEALDQLAQARLIQARLDRPNPLKIMDDLLRIMPLDVHILAWKQANQTITVTFTGKNLLNSAQLVEKVQALPYVHSVRSGDAREGQLELRIELKP